MALFDEKVLMCLENIVDFAETIKNIHDISKCDLDVCFVGMFSDELYSYFYLKRQSPRLAKNFLLGLCEKYPQGFDDWFIIARNKNYLINYSSELNK